MRLERFQCEFIRSFLGCPGAPQLFVRSETGIESIRYRLDLLTMRYWLKILSMPTDRLLSWVVFNRFQQVLRGDGRLSWCWAVRDVFARYGLLEDWLNGCAALTARSVCDRLKAVLSNGCGPADSPSGFGMRTYLMNRSNVKGTILKTRLRAGTLPVMAWIGRQMRWPKELCDCPLCGSGEVEDVSHLLCSCAAFRRLRCDFVAELGPLCNLPGGQRLFDQCRCCLTEGNSAAFVSLLCKSWGADAASSFLERTIKNYLSAVWRYRESLCGKWQLRCNNGITRLVRKSN